MPKTKTIEDAPPEYSNSEALAWVNGYEQAVEDATAEMTEKIYSAAQNIQAEMARRYDRKELLNAIVREVGRQPDERELLRLGWSRKAVDRVTTDLIAVAAGWKLEGVNA